MLLLLPVLVVPAAFFVPAGETWQRLPQTVLPEYVMNTVAVAVAVPAAAGVVGTALAWLTTRYEFPGRHALTAVAVLPLAVPSYIAAYSYSGLLDYTGPLQAGLRALGVLARPGASDGGVVLERVHLLPVASLPGLIVILTLVLYPYVFLTARAAFQLRSERLLEAAQSLGAGDRLFLRVALPAARPAVAGGMLLVLMETVATYGAPQYLGVDTLTVGIFRSWFGSGSVPTALRLAALLLLLVLVATGMERAGRGRARFDEAATGIGARRMERKPLSRLHARVLVSAFGWFPPVLGFAVPVLLLLYWLTGSVGRLELAPSILESLRGTAVAAASAAVAAVAIGVGFAWVGRPAGRPSRPLSGLLTASSSGYAVPGAVIAVGVLAVTTGVDRLAIPAVDIVLGVAPRGVLTGSFVALVYAYVVRYLAVAYKPIAGGLAGVGPNPEAAARSLGRSPRETFAAVHLPLGWGAYVAAFVLVFVDVAKELPLTLVLRPFDFRTLAVEAFALASDERLAEAAPPSLLLVCLGVLGLGIGSKAMRAGGGLVGKR